MSNTSTNNAPSIIIPATSSESTEVSGGANSEKSLNPVVSVDFTEILSNVPEVQGDEILIVNRNGIGSVTSKSDEEKLLDKIMQASTAGDRDTAELLVRLYGKLTSSTSLNPPTNLAEMRSISSDTSLPGQPAGKPAGKALVFVNGALAGHMEIGFTPFFDKALRNLHGIIPLTIFDKAWQEYGGTDPPL
ncbi:hypothetical protein Pst134EA_009275 [Puccinia striiformis f. sp. tritici]|nr:hypothetical protein Pst134EA_009275 [Puccinia striiformis f. sp. tritici]KAH9468743.1 hypothetical protein Pst134EA_009275 [Puccinia striiformis f. sp. tritici]